VPIVSQETSVWAERQSPEAVRIKLPLHALDLPAGLDIPEPNRGIRRACGEFLPIRCEIHGVHDRLVTFETTNNLQRLAIVQVHPKGMRHGQIPAI
jgi:hypothetical protein